MATFKERYRRAQGFTWTAATEEPIWAPPPEPEIPEVNPWDDTVLGTDEDGDEITISAKDRCEHTLLLGKTGQGKSVLMRYLMRQDIMSGRGFVCLDPHGSLLDGVLRDIPLWRQKDVVYLDIADEEWPFGLNLFETPRSSSPKAMSSMTDQLVQVFKKTWEGPWATTTGDWLKVIAFTFMDNRHGTMANIPKLLTDASYRESYMPRLKHIQSRLMWDGAVNKRTGEIAKADIDPTLRRMRGFLMNPIIENIVGQEKTTLDFAGWMRDGKIVLIRLPGEGDEGIGEAAVGLLGTVIMQLILRAAFSRNVGDILYPVYCDEFQHFVTPDMPKIIMNVRKYGVGLLLATQSFSNIKEEEVRDAIMNVGSLLCYQTSEKDARIVAGEFRRGIELDEDWEERIKTRLLSDGSRYSYEETVYQRPTKTETASRLANLQPILGKGKCLVKTNRGEFVATIPNVERLPVAGPIAKRGLIIRDSREKYCRPREEVEREIRAELLPDAEEEAATALYDMPPPTW